jgi:hypothetical protein
MELQTNLHFPQGYEFHFTENPKSVREKFLQAVAPLEFTYHIFALDKDPGKLYGPGFQFKESLYKFATRLTFDNAARYLDNATVIIDRCGDRKFRDELAAYLRRRVVDPDGQRIIRKVKMQDSKGNNLLQLADYIASISNRAISDKKDGIDFRRAYLAKHEVTRQIWPK